jgi:hypothetical protein
VKTENATSLRKDEVLTGAEAGSQAQFYHAFWAVPARLEPASGTQFPLVPAPDLLILLGFGGS